jgi:hypothetical protein
MHEVPLMPLWVTLFLTIWAPVGPLIGLVIGHYLSRSQQRRRWLADERTKEWRELLTTLTTSMTTIIQCRQGGRTVEMMKNHLRASVAAGEVLSNRLLIAKEVRQRQLLDRWHEAVHSFESDGDAEAFGTKFGRGGTLPDRRRGQGGHKQDLARCT